MVTIEPVTRFTDCIRLLLTIRMAPGPLSIGGDVMKQVCENEKVFINRDNEHSNILPARWLFVRIGINRLVLLSAKCSWLLKH